MSYKDYNHSVFTEYPTGFLARHFGKRYRIVQKSSYLIHKIQSQNSIQTDTSSLKNI